jgi:peroxin-19
MENLLKGLDVGSAKGSGGDGADEEALTQEERDKLQAVWAAALVEQLAGNNDAGPSGSRNPLGTGNDDKSTNPNNFQWQIKQAMEKLKESESNLKVRHAIYQSRRSLT